jgi:CheY-like chemotaxis protein/HPt (histidine-containing phosphotransfer) domain-containing protein
VSDINLAQQRRALPGVREAVARTDSTVPPGISVDNLRRRGIDRLKLVINRPVPRGLIGKILGLSRSPGGPTETITIADHKVHVEIPGPGRGEMVRKVIPFADVKSIILRNPRGSDASLVLSYADTGLVLGKGLATDALAWLRDRMLLELAGLVWKPVFNVGRRTTRKLSTEDDEFYTEWRPGPNSLIDAFMAEAPAKAELLADRIAAGDWSGAKKHVHWLKSSCASVGAAHLSELCQRIEIEIDINDRARIRILGNTFAAEFAKVVATLNRIRQPDEGAEEAEATGAQKSEHEETAAPAMQQLAGAKVLVVEDSKVNQLVARDYLQQAGCEVTTVDDGRSAVEVCETSSFDLVLMDCQMPGMDGFEATRIIREKENAKRMRTPIVALTAQALRDDKAKCLSAGMCDYLSKPYTRDEIVDMVNKWWKHEREVAVPAA